MKSGKEMQRLILLIITAFLLSVTQSYAAIITVSSVEELQTNVVNASEGDVILLSNDFESGYTELTVPGVNVTVDGGGRIWTNGAIVIKGVLTGTLTIRNLKVDGVTINKRLLTNNAERGKVILENMEFYNAQHGAIDISTPIEAKTEINLTRIRNNIANNTAPAIWLGTKANLLISYCSIENNEGRGVDRLTGAISSENYEANLDIQNTVFRKNKNRCSGTSSLFGAGGGGAIAFYRLKKTVNISESIFEGNESSGEGIYIANTYDGGAINIYDGTAGAIFSIDKSTFSNNIAYDNGGAIMFQGTGNPGLTTNVTNCTFFNNKAYGLSDDSYSSTSGTVISGGAILYLKNGGSAKMINNLLSCTLVSNVGGNLNSTVNHIGGAIGIDGVGAYATASLTRNNCLFVGNLVYGSNQEINTASTYKDISNYQTVQAGTANVFNIDKGDNPQYKIKSLLGTENPILLENQSNIQAGVDKEIIKTIPIVPQSIADSTYSGTVALPSVDQRGFERDKDQGAVEIAWVKYYANGGTFGLTALTSYDGTEYYEANNDGKYLTYYTVGNIAGETNIVDACNAKLNATHPDGLVFKGWAKVAGKDLTAPDPEYSVGKKVTYGKDSLVLYAIWGEAPVIYKVSYDPNGGGGSAQAIDCKTDNTHTILNYNATELAFTPPTSNHEFKGWNTMADGSGTSYTVGHINTFTEKVTLFAQWEKKELPTVFKVTYYPNEGSGMPRSIYCSFDRSHVIINYTDAPLKYTPPSEKHQFVTWNTAADGSGISYTAGDKIYPIKDTDLFAIWTEAVTPIISDRPSDPPIGIKVIPSGSFCPTDSFVTIISELLYKAELLEYVIKFSDSAKAVDFKDMQDYEKLSLANITIPLPTDVPTGKYSGTILLRAPSGTNIKTDYPFEFELLRGVEIVNGPESISSCMDDPFTLSVEATGESLSYQWYHEDKEIDGAINSEYTGTVSASTAGNYYVEVTGTCGTVRSETVYVRMNTLQILMKWDDVLYVDNTANRYVKFQWYKNGQAIDKFGTSIYYTEQEGLSGSFVVRAYYADGTYDESCPLVVSSNTPKSSVKVYPNPVYKNSTLKVEGKLASGEYTGFLIEMYDLSGRLIYYRYSDSEITNVPVHADSGVYLLHVTAPNGKRTETKVIVK